MRISRAGAIRWFCVWIDGPPEGGAAKISAPAGEIAGFRPIGAAN
jgi:hypothetical protein